MQLRTLGDILSYRPDPTFGADWSCLVRSIADGDQAAAYALYDRSHRAVFTLLRRRTANVRIAEELTVEVYVDAWNLARAYGPGETSPFAWIMNLAQRRATAHLRGPGRPASGDRWLEALLGIDPPDPRDVTDGRREASAIAASIARLDSAERKAIEGTFFAARTYVECAESIGEPREVVLQHLWSAMRRLREEGRATSTCPEAATVAAHALDALPSASVDAIDRHLQGCSACREELAALRDVVRRFAWWPTDLLRPSGTLRDRVARRIGALCDRGPSPVPSRAWTEPAWTEVAPGLSYKLLEASSIGDMVGLLVRLAPGGEYPAHTHAGIEELHLLEGELWIDYRKVYAGEYNRGEPGGRDRHVWSETGCMCVLVTSTRDRFD